MHILALENGMSGHGNFYQKIPSRPAVHPRLAFLPNAHTLAIVDPCRMDTEMVFRLDTYPVPAAIRTFLFDDLTGAVAVRTSLYILNCSKEGLLRKDHLAFAAAFWTGNRRGPRFCSGAATLGAGIFKDNVQLFLAAKHCLFEGDPHALSDVHPLHRSLAGAASSPAAKQITENIAENVAEIRAAEIEPAESAGASGSSFKGGVDRTDRTGAASPDR